MGKDLDLEKLALRLLCAGTAEGHVGDTLVPLLHDYAWRSTLHRAIFDAIAAAPSSDPELLRQLFPAKLTRMGFPDVDWAELFTPSPISKEKAIALVRRMCAGS